MIERIRRRSGPQTEERTLSREAKLSLMIHFFFQFGASMSGVFLNLYLWRLTGDLWINGMYNIINFSVTIAAFIAGGWIAKRTDRMYVYRLGLVLISLFYICVIIAGENVVHWYGLFALFGGISSSFYWTGYLVLMYDVSDDRNRIHYLAMNNIFFTAAGLIGPALAGRIIASFDGLHGYMMVFGFAFVMFILAAIGSLRIGPKPAKHKTYYLPHTITMMRRNPMWLRSLWAYLIYGLLQGIMLFLPNILLYQVMSREDKVGYMTVAFSLITILMGTLISRYAKERYSGLYLQVSAVGLVAGASLMLFGLNVWTVIGFMVVYSFFNPLQGNTLTTIFYRLVGTLPLKGNFRVESVVVREFFINTGRVISIFTLILFLKELDGRQLAWVLIAGSVCQLFIPLMLRHTEKTTTASPLGSGKIKGSA
ncbi:MFS transporter [Gorillibacterium sp. sgz5001074]|uniref:MFS transporter n=1 Tax=Gorillibacterium sp. sgz5001074 TaxID=3446695 RepID=UPI003F664DA9